MPIKVIAPVTPTVTVERSAARSVAIYSNRGEQGPVGPQGPQGPQGPIGPSNIEVINAHIADETPHAAYDDIPSLTLLFENGIV